MKVQVIIDIPEVSKLSSDELDGIRMSIGIALSDELNLSTTRVCHLEVCDE